MARRERPLDEGDTALLRFARDLRALREGAGKPTYRELSDRAHYSEATLSQAAAGHKLPTLAVTLAYVQACGGAAGEWEERWRAVAAELDGPRPGDQEDSPYVGMAALQPTDVNRFFGRECLVRELQTRLARRRLVLVFGASGAGKSSLLRAGLIPRWEGPVLLFTPCTHPLREYAARLARHTGTPQAPLEDDPDALRRAASDGRELLIVVDQFEEVFTLCDDEKERHRFLEALLTAARAEEGGCRVVLGVRADFFAHCTAFPGLVEALHGGQLTIGPMRPDELRQAITQPAVRAGYTVETALLTELIAQANTRIGVLPLLSHALLETWRRRRGNALTLTGYQATGGIEGALTKTAETVYGGLSASQRRVAKDLLLRLTALGEGTEDTKRRVARAELSGDQDVRLVLDRLADARLITLGVDDVEIAHEALIVSWPRLRDWLAEDREGLRLRHELTAATTAWESLDRDPGSLYRGVRLARAAEWAQAGGGATLAERERAFLDASLAAVRAERDLARRHGNRLRNAVVLLSVLLLLTAGTMTYAISGRQSAARQRDLALSQIVAGKIAGLRTTDPELAAQLSLAAYRLAPSTEARASVLASLPYPYATPLAGHTENVNLVAFSADGRTVITTSHDHTARLWDARDPYRPVALARLGGHTSSVNGAAFHPGGRLAATAGWDRTARLWDISDRRHPVELSRLGTHTGEVNAVTFSPAGDVAATVSSDRTAKLWDVTDPRAPREITTLKGHTDGVVAAAFHPGGRMLATASFDHTVALWDLARGGMRTTLTGHHAPVTWVAFARDGGRLVSTSQDGTASVWAVADGRLLGTLSGHGAFVRSAAFHPRGTTVATAGEDGTARLWDVSRPGRYRPIGVLEGHGDRVTSVAFSPDGRTILTGGDDDVARRWGYPEQWPDRPGVDAAETWLCGNVATPIGAARWHAYFPGVPYRPPCP
ncbi:hypothetical protein DP939_08305 [Spongiactinospora rosea]|uniref:HTH cro/C1-type domain-containing protein n=1 Tax=Spongiactinospora rosea TaxID=2248750 RepID=A0A366M4D3_9ACTN|nr:hypothetical protein [Spongiactinospora rosea]RBQ21045.1 hypothetical protein DP939_08305 [Spongiactinospora rosea]